MVHAQFLEILETGLEFIGNEKQHCGNVFFKVAQTQADCFIEYMAVHSMIDRAVNGSDFAVVAGSKMLMIEDYKMKKATKQNLPNISDCMLASSSYSVLEDDIMNALKLNIGIIKTAKYPLLEMIDPMMRAVVAVGMDCDTFPTGAPSIGAATIMKWKQNQPEATANDLLKFLSDKLGISTNLPQAYAMAILYEPANTTDDGDKPIFIHYPCEHFPEYLHEFTAGTDIWIMNTQYNRNVVAHQRSAMSLLLES